MTVSFMEMARKPESGTADSKCGPGWPAARRLPIPGAGLTLSATALETAGARQGRATCRAEGRAIRGGQDRRIAALYRRLQPQGPLFSGGAGAGAVTCSRRPGPGIVSPSLRVMRRHAPCAGRVAGSISAHRCAGRSRRPARAGPLQRRGPKAVLLIQTGRQAAGTAACLYPISRHRRGVRTSR
jgi:hypothetical protein